MSGKTFCKIQSLHLYPIKSAGSVEVSTVEIDEWGLRHDREFMVVDGSGRFVTRRESPNLARVETAFAEDHLAIRVGDREHRVPLEASSSVTSLTPARIPVRVWKSDVIADRVDLPDLDRDLSKLLGKEVALVRYGRESRREVVKSGRAWGRQFRFADSANFLVTSVESLKDLNARLGAPITMAHFRPNIVVQGPSAWEEDRWSFLEHAGGLRLEILGGCGRCAVINQNPSTGETPSKEPLMKLAEFRRFGASLDFGVHAVHGLPTDPQLPILLKTEDPLQIHLRP